MADAVLEVLMHVAEGRSPFHGYDEGISAGAKGEVRSAFSIRAGTIDYARQRGFLDAANRLTEAGRDGVRRHRELVEAWEHGAL